MHIKTLEICGFKSFVDRTVIHFDHDVIGIVGPNGCGKSNIVDAIRWCMGEQSAKHLRGKSMEDVIFNGSESRGPHGFAEVTLTFDNSDPVEAADMPDEYRHFPEIAVTRRLYRDGTSEYLINKTQVRLRDITDLFLGTGVGTKAYSIVEQVRIGQIVSARPEDRRIFIEEAAGITKYKVRRKQAERKIELTRQNLARVSDILGEKERTRNSLKRQVAKAERYLEHRAELEDLTLHEASHRHLEFVVMSRVHGELYELNSGRAGQLREQLGELENGLDDMRLSGLELESEADEMSKAAFEADNEVTSLQSEIQRSRDRMATLADKITTAEREQAELAERRTRLESELDDQSRRVAELGRDQQARESDAASEVEALEALRGEEVRAMEAVHVLRQQMTEAGRQTASTEAKIEGLLGRLQERRNRRDRLALETETIVAELGELQARRGALETSVAELAEGKRVSTEEKAQLELEVTELRGRQLDSERRTDASKNELGVKRNRLRAIEELHRKHQGVGTGVRALLAFGDPAVLGLVADRLEAPAQIQDALAGLLGEQLQNVVVSDLGRGVELLSRLRAERRGRAQIVAARPAYVAGRRSSLPRRAEVFGYLLDLLRFNPEDEALARSLVGDAVVVDGTTTALELASQHPELTLVTLDGTVVRPNGVVSGGTGDDVAAHMVEQKRELRVLGEEVAKLETEHALVAEQHQSLRSRFAEVSTALDRARQEAHQGELAHVTSEKDLARTVDQIQRLSSRQDNLDLEARDIDTGLGDANREVETLSVQLDQLRGDVGRLGDDLAQADMQASEWRERVAAQSSMVTERKVRLAQVREQVDAGRAAAERLTQSMADVDHRARRLLTDIHEAAEAQGEAAARIYLAREGRGDAETRAREAHTRHESIRERLDEVRQVLGERDHGLRGIREELDQVEVESRRAEMALTKLRIENDLLLQTIREKFRGLELPTVIGDYHRRPMPDSEQRRRIQELSELIDRMGPVNLDAKAEYEDADRLFTELNTQKLDLEAALEDLDKAIKLMNKESRKRFREAFDAINELFKQSFVRNFRGGRAELVLTDPEDLLATGVDVVAQPPGKKLGNIELMSGGEKALTAVSLIFAIFEYKPSPFCILDEVDAPLDEANVARYNEAIRSMTDRSQFILITHIRKTMQSVDVLYGVTMGEPGVSRIVSVKVNENASVRSEARSTNALTQSSPPPGTVVEEPAQEAVA